MADHKRNTEKVIVYMPALKAAGLKARAKAARTSRSSLVNEILSVTDQCEIEKREAALKKISSFEQGITGFRCDLARLGNLLKREGGHEALIAEIRTAVVDLRGLIVQIKHGKQDKGGGL